MFFLISPELLFPQAYEYSIYQDDDGLPSNLVKKVVVDDEGFIWAATDAGVAKFDGINFTPYTDVFSSKYIKDIFATGKDSFFVVTDNSAGYLVINDHGYGYVPVVSDETEKGLNYPKKAFLKANGDIWIACIDRVVKYSEGKIKIYALPDKYYSDSYVRSFFFHEDPSGIMLLFSYQGYILFYSRETDSFMEIQVPFTETVHIDEVIYYNGYYYIGSQNGIYRYDLKENQISLIIDIDSVSSLCFTEREIIFGTWGDGIYRANHDGSGVKKIGPDISGSVYSVVEDPKGAIWISSDEGVAYLSEHFFGKFEPEVYNDFSISPFVKKVSASGAHDVLFTDQNGVYGVTIGTDRAPAIRTISMDSNAPALEFEETAEGLWISYTNGKLVFFDRSGRRMFQKTFGGDRVVCLKNDSEGNLWGFLEKKGEIIKITKNFYLEQHNPFKDGLMVKVIAEPQEGKIWFGGSGRFFAFVYDLNTRKFEIIPGLNAAPNTGYTVNDIAADGNGHIVIGTSDGMIVLDDTEDLSLIEETFNKTAVKALALSGKGELWIGTDKGVFRQYKNELVSFSRENGLPNSTIVEKGLAFDKNGRLWAATPGGLSFWQKRNRKIDSTAKPLFISVTGLDPEKRTIEDQNLEITFTSPHYPPDKNLYQVMIEGYDKEWREQTSRNTFVHAKFPPGNYIFKVRAKQSGYLWSEPASFGFQVSVPWYLNDWMMLAYLTLGSFGFFFVAMVRRKQKIKNLERRRAELTDQVEERTKALKIEKDKTENLLLETEKAKKELEEANKFKGQLLNIAAHDLKNPLQSLLGIVPLLKDDNQYYKEYKDELDVISDSSERMLKIINKMLESAEASSARLKYEKVQISELIQQVVQHNKNLADAKKQAIVTDLDPNIISFADPFWFKVIIENLLTNAVKYSPFGKKIEIKSWEAEGDILISVKDEGPGFSEDDKKIMFSKFQKLSAKPTGNETSTGLGLFIIKEALNKHKGSIKLISSSGEGSEFIITLRKSIDE